MSLKIMAKFYFVTVMKLQRNSAPYDNIFRVSAPGQQCHSDLHSCN